MIFISEHGNGGGGGVKIALAFNKVRDLTLQVTSVSWSLNLWTNAGHSLWTRGSNTSSMHQNNQQWTH